MNKSGIQPVEFKVLVKQDEVEKQTDGGIIIPTQASERQQWAETKATLIAVGGNAFSDWEDPKPKAGDRVIVRQYAGYNVTGDDEQSYQVCNDKDISALLVGTGDG